MASYDEASFDRMRQEAVARAREMQRRAQIPVNFSSAGRDSERRPEAPSGHSAPPPPPPSPPSNTTPQKNSGIGGILSSILGNDTKIDEEKALIGMLIYILYKNGADVKLMLALGYLLL